MTFAELQSSDDAEGKTWSTAILEATRPEKLPAYQQAYLRYMKSCGETQTDLARCGMCDFVPTRGSNAYANRLVCKECGYKKSVVRDDQLYLDQSTCPHRRVNNLKSTKTTVNFFC